VLDAALRVASEDGVGAVTVHRLAKELGWSAGALYRHFPSMAAVISSLVGEVLDRLGPELEAGAARASAAQPELGPLAGVAGAIAAYAAWGRREPAAFSLVDRMVGDREIHVSGDAGDALVARVLVTLGGLAGRFDAAVEAGQLAPGSAPVRIAMAWSSVHGALRMRKMAGRSGGALSVDELVDAVGPTLLRGWGASDEMARAAWAAAVEVV
jgi:AcrR family transcriptional regulator